MVSKLLEPFIGGAFHELPRSTQGAPRGLRPDARGTGPSSSAFPPAPSATMRPASASPRRTCCCGCSTRCALTPTSSSAAATAAAASISPGPSARCWKNTARSLPSGRDTVRSVTDALCDYRDELTEERGGKREPRLIPLYNSPAAAGYAAPVLDEDFTYIPADESVPRGADFAVRIQGDSMEPYIHDKSVVYVNRDPLADGDVGIFCVDGAIPLQAVPPRCAGHGLPFLPQPRPRRRGRRAQLHRHAQPCLLRPRDAAAPPRGPAAVASLIFCAKNELFAREGLESFTTRAYNSNSVKSRKRKRIPP